MILRKLNWKLIAGTIMIWVAAIHGIPATAQDTIFNYNPLLSKYYQINDPSFAFHLDTSIIHFNRFNPVETSFGYLHTGHLGAAAAPMFYKPAGNVDFDLGFHQFDPYWRSAGEVRFYDSRQPFTQVSYQQGTKVEVLGSFIHTQNILPQLSLGVDMKRYRADGFYQRQVSKITNFDAFARYASQNGFYHVNAAYVLNSLKVEENGGVENLDVFTDTSLLDKSIQPVLLDSAYVNWKGDAAFLQNAFDFGKWSLVKKNDSVSVNTVMPEFRLQHLFKYEKRGYRFRDAAIDSAYYMNIYIDSLITRDTVESDNYQNEIRLRAFERKSGLLHGLEGDLFFKHDLYSISSNLEPEIVQLGVGGFSTHYAVKSDSSSRFALDIYLAAQYSFFDFNAGDYHVDFTTGFLTSGNHQLTLKLQFDKNHPSYIMQQYLSNHFYWENEFAPTASNMAVVSWLVQRWRLTLSARVFQVENYVYWNGSALPAQYTSLLKGYALFLVKDFSFKSFHFDNEFQYQGFNNDTVVAYPDFMARSSLYFQNRLFKGALTSKIGLDIRYNTNYHAPAYMPETGQFYLQRFSELSYYPVFDLFITIQVKGVRAFAMIQHINQDLFRPGYFSVYRSPMPDRSFRLGLEWRFWN